MTLSPEDRQNLSHAITLIQTILNRDTTPPSIHTDWIQEHLVPMRAGEAEIHTVYAAYHRWCEDHGHQPLPKRKFGTLIPGPRYKNNSRTYYTGVTYHP